MKIKVLTTFFTERKLFNMVINFGLLNRYHFDYLNTKLLHKIHFEHLNNTFK